MIYETPDDWTARPPQARRALRHVRPRQDPHRRHAARGGRLVPLLGRFPHRHPLHGRAHRRQLQARGDAQPVPARSCCARTRSTSPPTSPSTTSSRSRPTSASPATRPRAASPSTSTSAASASTATPRSPPPATRCRFIAKAEEIYGYEHFVCDTSGSLCEVVDPDDPADPVMTDLAGATLPVWFRGTEDDLEALTAPLRPGAEADVLPRGLPDPALARLPRRAAASPPTQVDPDAFIRHGFRALMAHRLPRYAAMADRWGVTVEAAEVAAVRDPQDFDALVADAPSPADERPRPPRPRRTTRPRARPRTTPRTPPAPAPSASPRC